MTLRTYLYIHAALFLIGALTSRIGTAAPTNAGPYTIVTVQGIELGYHVNGPLLEARVICPTTGWAAVGFEPSNMMKDANIIIGYVDASGQGVIRDDFGDTKRSHKADSSLGGRSDVTLVAAVEAGGKTTLEFNIPLDSGDKFDVPLVAGKLTHVILACGKNGAKDLTSIHERVAVTQVTLD